jgi:CheY-like chemotaxis protein
MGIAPQDQQRIFEEFEQIGHARDQGTGLGLAISRRLAALLDGKLELTSELGAGASFTLTLPRIHPEVKEMHEVTQRSQVLDPARQPVLVVEDDRKTMFVYERYLSLGGFQVIPARTVEEAREAMKRVRPAAILLDIMLERESTWAFLAELKKDPATIDIPVLVVTITNKAQKARALGADEFWLKPIDKDRLLKKLHAIATPPGMYTRILVIDDDERARYVLRKHLEAESEFKLFEASSGPEGVTMANQHLPNVIFLDFLLRDQTAFDVLDELKANPRTRGIPVIINTAQDLDEDQIARLGEVTESIVSKEHLSRELAINRIRDALDRAGVKAHRSDA